MKKFTQEWLIKNNIQSIKEVTEGSFGKYFLVRNFKGGYYKYSAEEYEKYINSLDDEIEEKTVRIKWYKNKKLNEI